MTPGYLECLSPAQTVFLLQIVAARALNHEHQMDLLTSIMAMMADEPFKVCTSS